MDKATLDKVIKICEYKIVQAVMTAFSLNGDITDEIKNELKVYVFSIDMIEGILEDLKGDGNYYD